MPTPQEYQDEIKGLNIDDLGYTLNTQSEYEQELNNAKIIKARLLQLKKDAEIDIDLAERKHQSAANEFRLAKKSNSRKTGFAALFSFRDSSSLEKQEVLIKKYNHFVDSYQEIKKSIESSLKTVDYRMSATESTLESFQVKVAPPRRPVETKKNSIEKKRQNQKLTQSSKAAPKTYYYHKYINTPKWRARAEAAKARAGQRCQVCNKSRDDVQLDAHHRTYERLGNELDEDITVLCRDCHQLYEDQKKANLKQPEIKGYCIRCGAEIDLKPTSPYCAPCFQVWKRFSNFEYKEKFCHICGGEKRTSRRSPACYDCYMQQKDKLKFP